MTHHKQTSAEQEYNFLQLLLNEVKASKILGERTRQPAQVLIKTEFVHPVPKIVDRTIMV